MTKSSGTHDAANFDPSTSIARLVEASLLFPSPPSSSTDLQSIPILDSVDSKSSKTVVPAPGQKNPLLGPWIGAARHRWQEIQRLVPRTISLLPSSWSPNLQTKLIISPFVKRWSTSSISSCWTCPCLKSFRLISPSLSSSFLQQLRMSF